MYKLPAILLAAALCCPLALARSHELNDIDNYCTEVRNQMSSVTPFIFSGPDPWTELDDPPAEMPDDALAYVYTQGPQIRWVFLRMVDDQGGWQEDVHYYFHEDGSIAKRFRRLVERPANVVLEETTYYDSGAILKQMTHHHPVLKGAKATADFTDPDAPEYLTVDDLPFPDIPDLWERLA